MTYDSEASQQAKAAIASRSALFERNFATGEIERLVDDYFVPETGRPMLCPPGGQPPIVGRKELEHQFRALRDLYTAINIETLEVEVGADLSSQLGRVRLTRTDGEIETGRYVVLWRLCDDGWRAKLDFFAADAWGD